MNNKHDLRTELRKSRKLFEKDHLFWPEPELAPLHPVLRSASIVAGYVRTGSEVDPAGLIARAVRLGKITALPWLADRSASLAFREWIPRQPLEDAPFGFPQPLSTAPLCEPDLILTPLLGFDRAMNRLGQGAGHYDRAFVSYPASLRIGLAWSVQECPGLTPDPWDVPLDAVLTEKEWIVGPLSRIRL